MQGELVMTQRDYDAERDPKPTVTTNWGWQAFFRHFTTITVILGAFWWLATPRVEAFINAAVEGRVSRIETRLDTIQQQVVDIRKLLDERLPLKEN